MMKQLLNSIRLPQNIVICQCLADHLRLRQMIDLLANDKSRYFCSTSSIIVIIFWGPESRFKQRNEADFN